MKKSKIPRKKCSALKTDGSACGAVALPGSDFCFFHDPARAEERREAQAEGGRGNRMKTLDSSIPDIQVEDCQDVVKLISVTINQVRKGELDPRIANTIGYLANVLIKAAEQGVLERRISDLESVINTSRKYEPITGGCL